MRCIFKPALNSEASSMLLQQLFQVTLVANKDEFLYHSDEAKLNSKYQDRIYIDGHATTEKVDALIQNTRCTAYMGSDKSHT